MEIQILDDQKSPSPEDSNPKVDTSRPFRSVKEAVAIFGEKVLAEEIYSPKPFNFPQQETPCYYTPSSPSSQKSHSETSVFDGNVDVKMVESLVKLQAELEETKLELRLLKERESETEVALASLNAELHMNMSKLARAEAAAAANALASRSAVSERIDHENHVQNGLKLRWNNTSTTLGQVLNVGEANEGLQLFGEKLKKKKKAMKKKPLIPLVGDLFSKKKGSSTSLQNPLFASHLSLN